MRRPLLRNWFITTYVAVIGDYTFIIKNVPCPECVQCYTDEVMQNIERIITKTKELNSEFFVAEYKQERAGDAIILCP